MGGTSNPRLHPTCNYGRRDYTARIYLHRQMAMSKHNRSRRKVNGPWGRPYHEERSERFWIVAGLQPWLIECWNCESYGSGGPAYWTEWAIRKAPDIEKNNTYRDIQSAIAMFDQDYAGMSMREYLERMFCDGHRFGSKAAVKRYIRQRKLKENAPRILSK